MQIVFCIDFQNDNYYNVAIASSTDVAMELRKFVKRFLSRVARSLHLAAHTPLRLVIKMFEQLVTSGKANNGILSTLCPRSNGLVNHKHLFPAVLVTCLHFCMRQRDPPSLIWTIIVEVQFIAADMRD